ncbi:hypothetical protein [Planctomonas psychrotolerans]|uniref:hypothetical protein n=1 Tax=Planctomonas psychrotolerans TaxID=2528712 RepID=UPI00123951E3|nr:hypothetical protein [Planctomonas psychrotolerans]
MSTDPAADGGGGPRPGRSRFRRVNGVVLTVLAGAAIALGAANATQGPRLNSAEINTRALVARAEQRLVLHANQSLTDIDASQVTVTPSVPVDVSVDAAAITIRFQEILDYDTDYSVSVADVTGAFTNAARRFDYDFVTPSVDVYTLLRNTTTEAGVDAPDRVLRNSPTGAESTVVFEAPRIQEYAASETVLMTVLQEQDDTTALVLTSLSDGVSTTVGTPAGGPLHDLRMSDELVGFRMGGELDAVTSTRPAPLFVLDLTDASGVPVQVVGLDGAPLPVLDYLFVPGTTALVAQAEDTQLYLVDPVTGTPPTPLGQHAELRGFVPGTTDLVVADPLSGSRIDLADGSVRPLDLPPAEADPVLTAGKIVVLGENTYLQQFDRFDYSEAQTSISSVLRLVDPTGTRPAYTPASESSRIRDFCMSPNGQLAAIEVVPAGSPVDDYDRLPAFTDITTYFVDVATGATRRSVSGFLPSWCR